jgi:hypothetical protein
MAQIVHTQTLFTVIFFPRGADDFDILVCSPALITS